MREDIDTERLIELARQGEANEAKLHEALGWAGEFHADLPVPTRVTLEVVDRLRRAERERDELLKLAYLGEHRFPDLTFKARLEELVPKLRKAERERDEARKTCPLLGDRLGSPGIIERSLAVKCLCVESYPIEPEKAEADATSGTADVLSNDEKKARVIRLWGEIAKLGVPWAVELYDGKTEVITYLGQGHDGSLSVVFGDRETGFMSVISMRVMARAMSLVCGFVQDATTPVAEPDEAKKEPAR